MTDNTNTETKKASKSPSYIAYHVRGGEGKDAFWTRVGAAFAHADGKGFTILTAAVPLDGKISLRLPSEKKD
jgi:hypothetical protein